MKGLLFFFAGWCLLHSSCNQSGKVIKIETSILSFQDTIIFELPNSGGGDQDIYFRIGHHIDYQYENVYFKFLPSPDHGPLKDTVISLQLSDQLGSWVGRCKGEVCTGEFLLYDGVQLSVGVMLKAVQFSREENLEGIKFLALRIEPSDS